jgi:hypothetical protein
MRELLSIDSIIQSEQNVFMDAQPQIASLQEVHGRIARLECEESGFELRNWSIRAAKTREEIAYLQRLIKTPLYQALQGK